jgi:hypothetical protein
LQYRNEIYLTFARPFHHITRNRFM